MDSSNDIRELFPIPRYFDYGEFNFYYPYGNTPAEDFLENVSPHSVKVPDILVLGCGDIRSCFYTLWKHDFTSEFACDPSASPSFSGVRFVLNDHSAAVLARNIIFLHLCLQKPTEAHSEEFKKWLCGLWAIWFSRDLLPAHEHMLNSSLKELLKHTTDISSWAAQENPLSSFVEFSSECTLSEIRDIWKMWSTHSVNINERQARKFMVSTSKNTDIENLLGMAMTILSLSSYERERMEHEIQLASSTGNSFAEYVVSDGLYIPPKILLPNLTMYGTPDGRFVMHSLLPFRCFHHGFRFSPSQLQLNCRDEKLLGKLIVADEMFEKYPLLANSVQQFALWISSASIHLSSTHASHGKQNVQGSTAFTFHCSDAIAFCNELQRPASKLRVEKKFDVIYTSNLIDPLYPPNLVLFAIPLLKPSSYLFTTTMKYKTLAHTTQEYLESSFGIDNKMFPVLFGIRCINHEGNQYKDMVSIRSAPVEANAISPEFTPYYVKVLMWEKVPSMVILKVPSDSILWRALYSSVSTILSIPPDSLNASSSQTVVKMLQMFLLHVNADDSDAQFWDPLCSLLQSNRTIEHLMTALQAHSLLSGLHLHLNVTSKTCPVCNGVDLSKYFGQFRVNVKPLTQSGTVHLYARIHKAETPTSSYSTFDCLASHNDGSSLSLCFIAPLYLCESGYYASVVRFENSQPLSILTSGPLLSFLESGITYSFPTFKIQNRSLNTSLGSVCSHYGNGDTFESVIKLSDVSYEAYLSYKKIHPEQLSLALIRISCGVHNLELLYPYPINFNFLSLTISRSKRTIKIIATRSRHRYEDEMASVFLVNPDNLLALPRLNLNQRVIGCLMNMQFSDNEHSIMSTGTFLSRPPLPDLKNCLIIMMQAKEVVYFSFLDPSESLCVMVMIVNRKFDYQLKAPAIDLIYYVTTMKTTIRKFAKFSSYCADVYEVSCNTIELMDKTFQYFSRRTICSLQAEGLLALHSIVDSGFKRAVVYPLYGDNDDMVTNQCKSRNQIMSDPKMIERQCCSYCGKLSINLKRCYYCQIIQFCDKCEKYQEDHMTLCEKKSKIKSETSFSNSSNTPSPKRCGYCHKSSAQLRKCSHCHSILYCNQDCQRKHWQEHKNSCCKQATDKSSSCSYCKTISDDLRRCTVCLSAQYCNKECQRKHWNEHKPHCSKFEDVRSLMSKKKTNAAECADEVRQDKCNFCSRVANNLKKCTRCLRAQYCDKICQQKHWPDHKLICKSEPS